MELFKTDIIGLIQYLLPGFLAAWVFYGLTPHEKAQPFERVVEALIFTAITQAFLAVIHGVWLGIAKLAGWGDWSSQTAFVCSVLIATAIGLGFAGLANSDWLHFRLRMWGLTKNTSFPSEWCAAFYQDKPPHWVVLHLKGDEKLRIYGWAEEFPDDPNEGHFVLGKAEWLTPDSAEGVAAANVHQILIPATEVKFVEFVEFAQE